MKNNDERQISMQPEAQFEAELGFRNIFPSREGFVAGSTVELSSCFFSILNHVRKNLF
jgi:hypothetical protein